MNEEVEISLLQDDVTVETPLVADYILPTATANTLGGVKIGDNINIDSNGSISVPIATDSSVGLVKAGTGLAVSSDGTLTATGTYELPEATKTTLGGVYVDDELFTSSTHPVQNAVVSLKLQELDGDVTSLNGTVSDLSTTVGNLSTTVGNLGTTVGNLSGTVTTQGNSITTIGGSISSIEDSISDIDDDITSLGNGLGQLQDNLDRAVTSTFSGIKLAIYGDSISTFTGYVPAGNAVYYTGSNAGVASVDDTWWKKVIDALNLDLLVNNSWSGRAVSNVRDGESGHTTDAGYKQDNIDVLGSEGTPEVIIIKLGINDFNHNAPLGTYDGSTTLPNDPTNFTDAYAIMLDRIMTTYPLAKVYCCTLMDCERSGSTGFPEINSNGDSLIEWNKAIITLAEAFGARVINHAVCGITQYNLATFTGDYDAQTGKGLHPNSYGMSLIANITIDEMDNTIRTRY